MKNHLIAAFAVLLLLAPPPAFAQVDGISMGAAPTAQPKIAFSAYLNAATQSIPDSTPTKVTLTATQYNVGGYFDITTNYRFTPLVAGYYQISARALQGSTISSTATLVQVSIYKNGALEKRGNNIYGNGAATNPASTANALVFLNGTGDYIELYYFQNDGGARNIGGGNFYDTFMTGVLASPQ